MAKYPDEFVMVFETNLLMRTGYFQGISKNIEKYLPIFINPKNTKFIARDDAEENFKYKQLIPYVIFRYKNKFLTYQRGIKSSEKRLESMRSLGIGGHISTNDPKIFSSSGDYKEGMKRELYEEVNYGPTSKEQIIGLINDDSNEVGRVHFGVIHLFELKQEDVTKKEAALIDLKFETIKELKNKINVYENWSKLCILLLEELEG